MKKTLSISYVLFILALLFTLPFWFTSLDITAAKVFYEPNGLEHWPQGKAHLWEFFYRVAPIIAMGMGTIAVAFFVLGTVSQKFRSFRMYGVLIFLSLSLGPGLFVNAVFKNNGGRPRPRQIQEFSGAYSYRPPLYFAAGDGRSFPCGHCSVGFQLGVFALLFWRKNKKIAWSIIIGTILLALFMGIGRMAAGAHFVSDIFWAGLITWAVILSLYALMRIPEREDNPAKFPAIPNPPAWVMTSFGSLALVVIVLAALIATPFDQKINGQTSQLVLNVEKSLSIKSPALFMTFTYVSDGPEISWHGKMKGFGFPGRKVVSELMVEEKSKNTKSNNTKSDNSSMGVLTFKKKGIFAELEGEVEFEVNASQVNSIEISIPESAIIKTVDSRNISERNKPLPVITRINTKK